MASSDPNISLLPQPSQPTPIEPMRGGGTGMVTDPNVSLLPQPSTATPIEPMRGGGDQVGTPSVSLLPQPSLPVPVEPMKGGAGSLKITQGVFQYFSKDFEKALPEDQQKPPILNVESVKKYITRRQFIWDYTKKAGYKPPALDPKAKDEDQEGYLNYFLDAEDTFSIFFVDSYTQFVNMRTFIKEDFNQRMKVKTIKKRHIYILFCISDSSQVYSNLFRGIVNAATDLPGNYADIFLLSLKTKMHAFDSVRGETEAINLLNRVQKRAETGISKAKSRLSYEPSVVSLPVITDQGSPIYLAFSGEKLDPPNYPYFGLDKSKTINIIGIQYFPKDEDTTLYFSTHKPRIELSSLKPGLVFEIKHYKYEKNAETTRKYTNLFKKGFLTFTIIDPRPVTPFGKKPKTEIAESPDEGESDIDAKVPPPVPMKILPTAISKKRKIVDTSMPTPEELEKEEEKLKEEAELKAKKEAEEKAKREELEKDMEAYRKKLRNAVSTGTSDTKLITINLNGELYKIRPYSTITWTDWGKLDFIEGEENLLKVIGMYEPLFTKPGTAEEKAEFDFYKSHIQGFFNDLGNTKSQCFREDRMLLTHECNNIREFLQKHYELLLKKRLSLIGKYSIEDLSVFEIKNIMNVPPPPPPGSAGISTTPIPTPVPTPSSTGGPGSPGKPRRPSGPSIWSPLFSPLSLLEFILHHKSRKPSTPHSPYDLLLAGVPAPVPTASVSTAPAGPTSPPGSNTLSSDFSLQSFSNEAGLIKPIPNKTLRTSIPMFII